MLLMHNTTGLAICRKIVVPYRFSTGATGARPPPLPSAVKGPTANQRWARVVVLAIPPANDGREQLLAVRLTEGRCYVKLAPGDKDQLELKARG